MSVKISVSILTLLKEPTTEAVSVAKEVCRLRAEHLQSKTHYRGKVGQDENINEIQTVTLPISLDALVREDLTTLLFKVNMQVHVLRAKLKACLIGKQLVVKGTQMTIVQIQSDGTIVMQDNWSKNQKEIPLSRRIIAMHCKQLEK